MEVEGDRGVAPAVAQKMVARDRESMSMESTASVSKCHFECRTGSTGHHSEKD